MLRSIFLSRFKTMFIGFTACLLTFSVSACSGQKASSTNSETSENAVQSEKMSVMAPGHALFLANCVRCHSGSGSPPGPDATITDSTRLNSEDSFRHLLRQPTSAMMKSFSPDELSDAQIHTLYEYVSSNRQPKK
jgi:mono/diheme cytochrome c family protein